MKVYIVFMDYSGYWDTVPEIVCGHLTEQDAKEKIAQLKKDDKHHTYYFEEVEIETSKEKQ